MVLYVVFPMNIYAYKRLENLNVGIGIFCFGSLVVWWMVKWIVCELEAPRRESIGKTHRDSKCLKWESQEIVHILSRLVKPAVGLHGTNTAAVAVLGKLPRLLLWSDHDAHQLGFKVFTVRSSTGHNASEVPGFQGVMEKVDLSTQLCICYFACILRMLERALPFWTAITCSQLA